MLSSPFLLSCSISALYQLPLLSFSRQINLTEIQKFLQTSCPIQLQSVNPFVPYSLGCCLVTLGGGFYVVFCLLNLISERTHICLKQQLSSVQLISHLSKVCLDVFCREAPVLWACVCEGRDKPEKQHGDWSMFTCCQMGGLALVKNISSLWFIFFSLSLMLSVLRVISCCYLFMQVLGVTCSLLCDEKVMLSALACDTEVTFIDP